MLSHKDHVSINSRQGFISMPGHEAIGYTPPLTVNNGKGWKTVLNAEYKGIVGDFEVGSFFDQEDSMGRPIKHDICVSTHAGCNRFCTHCATPTSPIPFQRLLTAEEIFAQVELAVRLRGRDDVPNVIGLMGNGEPLGNTRNVLGALQMMNDLPIKRATISTIGDSLDNIKTVTDAVASGLFNFPVKFQYSLHAADEPTRDVIVPTKGHKHQDIGSSVRAFDAFTMQTGFPVKYNVVLMENPTSGFTNASKKHAYELAQLLLKAHTHTSEPVKRILKLSAYNPHEKAPYQAPSQETIHSFLEVLAKEGITEIKTFQGTTPLACGKLREGTHIL